MLGDAEAHAEGAGIRHLGQYPFVLSLSKDERILFRCPTKLHLGLRLLGVLHGSACADCAEEAGDKPPRYERLMKILLALPREIKPSPGAKIHATQPGKRRSR